MLRLAALVLALAVPATALAQQVFESVGIRALGMGGAFVAVADDATAVYWNPAGLATARPFGMTIEWDQLQSSNLDGPPRPGQFGRDTKFTGVGSWPFGLFYNRVQTSVLVPSAGEAPVAETFRTIQYGGTIVQTLLEGLVIGTSLKYVRGFTSSGPVPARTGEDALDLADDVEGHESGTFDMDIGLMADLQKLRIGLTVRNLLEPEFETLAGPAIGLQRQTRLGVAVLPTDGLTLALDVDLDTVDLRDGLRRMIALGGEQRLGRRVVVRGGARWNLKEDHRAVGSLGASFAIQPQWWVDAQFTRGGVDEDRGFGVALRAGY